MNRLLVCEKLVQVRRTQLHPFMEAAHERKPSAQLSRRFMWPPPSALPYRWPRGPRGRKFDSRPICRRKRVRLMLWRGIKGEVNGGEAL